MIKIGEKGEKMSIRKGLTLLLLAAFGLSTIAPALAINVNNGITFQTLAQDEGSASNGAKPDVVATDIIFELNNAGDLFLATDGTAIANGDEAHFTTDGVLTPTGGYTVPAQAVTLFEAPTNCAFVKLPGYEEVTTAASIDLDDGTNPTDVFTNVSVLNTGNLPQDNNQGNYIVAQVLDAQPSAISNDATLPTSGLLAIHAFTSVNSATQNSALVRVTTQNIGLACDASSSALTTGDISATVVQPNLGSYVQALPNLTNGSTIKIAEYGDNVGKLEAIVAGDVTGNTGGVSEDTQPATLISNTALNNVTSVNFGPAEITDNSPVGATTNLDLDTILIRAAEQPNSTNSAALFYQTPFATAEFVSSQNLNTNANALTGADLSSSTLFDNESNALIEVEIEITAFNGGTSDATLSVTNAFVGIEAPSAASATVATNGFLGALAYALTDTANYDIAATDAGLIAVDPSAADGSHVIDGLATDFSVLTNVIGDAEADLGAAANRTIDDSTDSANNNFELSAITATSATDSEFLFPGIFIDDAINNGNVGVGVSITNVSSTTTDPDITFTFSSNVGFANADQLRNSRSVFTNLVPANGTTDGTQYIIINGHQDGATSSAAKSSITLAATNLFEAADSYDGPAKIKADTGGVATFTIATAGTSYDEGGAHQLTQTATSGTGTGFIADLDDDSGNMNDVPDLAELSVNTAGSGYNIGDTITLSDGDAGTDLVIQVASVSGGTTSTPTDNVVLASRLVSAGDNKKFTVQILPFVNKYDGVRDVISVRPKGTITFGSNTLTDGLKLKATVSGNNLNGETELTLASILPANSFTSGITARLLPVNGAMNALMQESSADASLSRATFAPSGLTGASATTDSFDDLIATGNVLDTTVPPLFGCGVAGNGLAGGSARGPIPCLQPKARAIAIEESADGDFKEINDLGSSVRVRLTMPVGVDINLYGTDGTDTNNFDDILNVFGTNGIDADSSTGGNQAPTVALTVEEVQPRSSTISQAHIDVVIPTYVATTNPITRGLYLVFRPDALVVPKGTTDLNVSLTVVDAGATATATTDDTVLSTLGTVALAPELSTFLNVEFAQSTVSTYETGTLTAGEDFITSLVTDKYGAQLTEFPSTISQVTRFLNNATVVEGELWDIIITEGTPDALPFGDDEDGIPTNYINGPSGGFTVGDKQIRCAFSNPSLIDLAGIVHTADTHRILFSDTSIEPDTATTNDAADVLLDEAELGGAANNTFVIPLQTGDLSGAPKADTVATSIQISDVMFEVNGNSSIVTDTDIACWFEITDDTTDGTTDANNSAVVGSLVGLSVGQGGTGSAIEYFPIFTADDTLADALATKFNSSSPAANDVVFTNADSVSRAVFNTTYKDMDVIIEDAITYVVDDSSSGIKLLDSSTPLTITSTTLPQINGADDTTGDVQVTVSAASNTLEPGTLITLTPSAPTSPAESVTVPVLDDGSFTAVLRAAPTAQITVTQTPSTNQTNANIQLKVLNVADAGTTPDPTDDPAFDGTVPTLLTSSLVEGQIVVLFDAPATTNFTFADVESTATVNGVAVTKLGDKFAAVVTTTGTYTLAVTVDGETVSTTLDVTTTEKSKKGSLKNLRALKTDKNGRFVLRQRRGKLPNDLNLEIVYDDGTTAVVNNADLSRNRLGVVKFDNPESDKTISYVQLLSAKKGSRVAQ